jgi:hypothetical protein
VRNIFFALILIFCVSGAFGEYANYYVYGEFQNNTEVYAFNDETKIYAEPSLDSKVIANLDIAYPLTIITRTENCETVNGYAQDWYEIGFSKNGKTSTGYILDGVLSIAAVRFQQDTDKDTALFLWNIISYDDKDYLQSCAKIVIKGEVVKNLTLPPVYTDFQPDKGYQYTVESSLVDDKGFSPPVKFFVLSFIYEACAYTNGDILISWNGEDMHYGLDATRVSDGGAFYYVSEVIFPSQEGGVENQVIVTEEQAYFDEDQDKYVIEIDRKTFYQWNGTRLVKVESE